MAAAGAGALLPHTSLLSQTAVRERQLVDVHHHLLPPTFITATQGRFVNPAQITAWSLERALAEMDANGVAMAFSSVTQPGVWLGKGVEAARKLSRECNEYQARVVQDHPGRFGAFAVLAAARHGRQPARVGIRARHAQGRRHRTAEQLRRQVAGRSAVHAGARGIEPPARGRSMSTPTRPTVAGTLMPSVSPNLIEYPQDSTRAITNLLFSGALNRLRDVRFIFSHGGGTLPMLAGRIAQLATPRDIEKIPNGVEAELKALYYEIANTAHRPAIAALREVAPISQIMFGTGLSVRADQVHSRWYDPRRSQRRRAARDCV
jgi:predicted TIM-barrel fold metal-dependent hydrolase